MNLFFDSVEDYAYNLQGPIVDAELLKATLSESSMSGDDIYDYIMEAGTEVSAEMEEDEHREDRYEQMASRHHCWCK